MATPPAHVQTAEVVPAAPAPLTPELAEVEVMRRLGHWLALAEADDDSERSRGAAAAVRLAFAKSLGLNLPSVQELSFIHGRLNLSAQLVRALAMRNGYRVVPVERTPESCTAAILVASTGQELGRTTYTIEDARKQGLVRDRSNWKTVPERMLWARASKRVVDDFAPEVSLGLLTPEESAEIDALPSLPNSSGDDAAAADPGAAASGAPPPAGADATPPSDHPRGRPPDPAAEVPALDPADADEYDRGLGEVDGGEEHTWDPEADDVPPPDDPDGDLR